MPMTAKVSRSGFISGSSSPGILNLLGPTPAIRAATTLFTVWIFALSGIFSDALHTPGVLQAVHLRALLSDKHDQVAKLRDELRNLKVEIEMLEKSTVVQRREIRRVLGYAAPDELIFDFSVPERLE